MRNYLTLILPIILSWGLLASVVWGGEISIKVPGYVADEFEAAILVDAGLQALGALEIKVFYNPRVLSIINVTGGKTKEFVRAPIIKANDKEGVLFLASFQAERLDGPTGLVDVANIKFKVTGASGNTSLLTLEVKTLADTNGDHIDNTAVSSGITVK